MRDAQREMPKYQCHKKVWALKIKAIHLDTPTAAALMESPPRGAVITPDDDGYAPFRVSAAYVSKHRPEVGGYFVVYDDGYESFSPAAAFESGYTLIG